MTTEQRAALLAIALLAMRADAVLSAAELDPVKQLATELGSHGEELAAAASAVDRGELDLAALACRLVDQDLRRQAFSLALAVCEADGLRNDAETLFLSDLGRALGLGLPEVAAAAADADALATAPLDRAGAVPAVEGPLQRVSDAAELAAAIAAQPSMLAPLAIVSAQMHLVRRIAEMYGHRPDRGAIRRFLVDVGGALTIQALRQAVWRLVGSVWNATEVDSRSVREAFAATYALGLVAARFYEAGQSMDASELRRQYDSERARAWSLAGARLPQIAARARALDPAEIVRATTSA